MNQIDLNGRNAVITGGCRGIGLAAADRFTRSGARITIWDVDVAAMKRVCAERSDWTWHQVDVTSETAIDAALKASVLALGSIDILVNAAGIAGSRVPAVDCSLSEWQRVLDVNLTGTFLCCRAVVRHMQERGYGRVVNLASIAGKEGNATAAHYSAAKAGVTALTKALAKESLVGDIRINAVAPAAVNTELFSALPLDSQKIAMSRIPLGRAGTVDEVAALIAWMASEECSFTTGFTFDASGGRATY
jgi:3-oxoacyl-[acyl-carrier protein] reductase